LNVTILSNEFQLHMAVLSHDQDMQEVF